jgi:hypothetical protein
MATWEEAAGQIYYAFDRTLNVKDTDNPDTTVLHIGCDFNISPIVASIAQRQGENLYVIDEIVLYSSNTNELADEIKNRYPKSKVWIYPDPAGAARKTSASGHTDHTILANAGFIVKAPRTHTPVRDRINAVNSRLCNAKGQRQLFISAKCKYTIKCIEKQVYKEGSNAIPEKGEFDHMNDALGYMVDWMWPVTRQREVKPGPQRWTHQIGK